MDIHLSKVLWGKKNRYSVCLVCFHTLEMCPLVASVSAPSMHKSFKPYILFFHFLKWIFPCQSPFFLSIGYELRYSLLYLPFPSVAKYQEANPGVFTIVTFPFLFAVMFGDWGHGICLLVTTLFLIIRERKYSSEVSIFLVVQGPPANVQVTSLII